MQDQAGGETCYEDWGKVGSEEGFIMFSGFWCGYVWSFWICTEKYIVSPTKEQWYIAIPPKEQ